MIQTLKAIHKQNFQKTNLTNTTIHKSSISDKISAERQRLEQQTKLNGESPTEITYMSGPSSESPRQQQRMLQQQGNFAIISLNDCQILLECEVGFNSITFFEDL